MKCVKGNKPSCQVCVAASLFPPTDAGPWAAPIPPGGFSAPIAARDVTTLGIIVGGVLPRGRPRCRNGAAANRRGNTAPFGSRKLGRSGLCSTPAPRTRSPPGIQQASPAMQDGALDVADDGMAFLQWEVGAENGRQRADRPLGALPAQAPPPAQVPIPRFAWISAQPMMQSTGPRAGTGALSTPAREWSMSRYSDRMRRECLRSWWILTHPRLIDYEELVLARSRELSVSHYMDRPWLLWD